MSDQQRQPTDVPAEQTPPPPTGDETPVTGPAESAGVEPPATETPVTAPAEATARPVNEPATERPETDAPATGTPTGRPETGTPGDRPAAAGQDAAARPDPDVPGAADPPDDGGEPAAGPPPRKLSSAAVMIAVLVALLGFTLVVQVKNNSTDPTLAAARQEDLVRILSDLEAREQRLREDIASLEESQRQLTSGAQGRQAALQEATRRGDELGILAGTLPARGPGLTVRFTAGGKPVRAAAILDAVQELRGAGAEAMQIAGGDGTPVRIVASTFFLDADGGVAVSGRTLSAPYTITVIGDPKTMRTALNIPGGVVASVSGDGGNVTIQEHEAVDVTALIEPKDLRYARPVS